MVLFDYIKDREHLTPWKYIFWFNHRVRNFVADRLYHEISPPKKALFYFAGSTQPKIVNVEAICYGSDNKTSYGFVEYDFMTDPDLDRVEFTD